jgi:hypothetical protein
MIEPDSAVYWRRRAVAGAGVVGVVLLGALVVSGSSEVPTTQQGRIPQAINVGSSQLTFQPPPDANTAQVSGMPSSLLPLPPALAQGANTDNSDDSSDGPAVPSAQALAPGSTLPGSPDYSAMPPGAQTPAGALRASAPQPGTTLLPNGATTPQGALPASVPAAAPSAQGAPQPGATMPLPSNNSPNLNSPQPNAPVSNGDALPNTATSGNSPMPNSAGTESNTTQHNTIQPNTALPNDSAGIPLPNSTDRHTTGLGKDPRTAPDQSNQNGPSQETLNQEPARPGKPTKPIGPHSSPAAGPTIQPPAPAATPACSDANIGLVAQVSASTFKIGQRPVFRLVVANLSGVPCTRDLNRGLRELQLNNSSGARVWDSNDCDPAHQTQAKAQVSVLEPGKPMVFPLTWAARSSAPGCSAAHRAQLPAGTYQLTGKLGRLISGAAQFTLTK